MIAVGIASVGLRGPSLPSWSSGRDWLAGLVNDAPESGEGPGWSPPAGSELRRTTGAVRVAMAAAQEAAQACGSSRELLHPVFASSAGDAPLLGSLLDTLADPTRAVSPTQFHNSVHNAAVGYWSILNSNRSPSTSLAAADSTFAVGLLRSALECRLRRVPVLFVAFDVPFPSPLDACRPLVAPFALALVLVPDAKTGVASAELSVEAKGPETSVGRAELRVLQAHNPAARGIPLLECLARGGSSAVSIGLSEHQSLHVRIEPC